MDDDPLELIEISWNTPLSDTVDWPSWCRAAGKDDWLQRAIFHHYDDEHYAVQAVLHGQGMVLASSVLVAEHVARGTLRPVLPSVRLPGERFLALCRAGHQREPQVRRFLEWLQQEMASTRDAVAQMRADHL